MTKKIKIDIISDVACPWCIIGYKRLEKAISELGFQGRIELEWHPFEINPDMPPEGEDLSDHIARKYGSTPDEILSSRTSMTQFGSEFGFKFDFFAGMKVFNTRDSHVLLELAKKSDNQTQLKMRLFEAFFSDRKDVSARTILTEVSQSAGLDAEEVLTVLDDSNARERVLDQENQWKEMGVSAVPTVVFNRSHAMTGAQSVEVYKRALLDSDNLHELH